MKELLPFTPTPVTPLIEKLRVELCALDILIRYGVKIQQQDGGELRREYYAECIRFFRKKRNRCIGIIGTGTADRNVETWWDRTSRNWVTQIRDGNRLEVADSLICGDMMTAATHHAEECWKIAQMLSPPDDRAIERRAFELLNKRAGAKPWLNQ